MRIWFMTAFIWVCFAANAMAADVHVYEYTNNGKSYIVYDGETTEGDLDKLTDAFYKALGDTEGFSGDVWLRGPGGLANEGKALAEFISEKRLRTVVGSDAMCVSACSLMWMAGGVDGRYITGDGQVGFHFAYTSDVDFLENQLDLNGWHGIQDGIAQSTHSFTAELFKYGVADAYEFLTQLSQYGSIKGAFWIYDGNINIVGGETF